MIKKIIILFLLVAIFITTSFALGQRASYIFIDLENDYKYYDWVQELMNKGIITNTNKSKLNLRDKSSGDYIFEITKKISCNDNLEKIEGELNLENVLNYMFGTKDYREAINYKLLFYDNKGNKKEYSFLSENGGDIEKGRIVTKEDIIKIAYIVFRSNICYYENNIDYEGLNNSDEISIKSSKDSGNYPLIVDLSVDIQKVDDYKFYRDFGNGKSGFGKKATISYNSPGEYNIILKAEDKNQKIRFATKKITVSGKGNCLKDFDDDGINDCEDQCPLVYGDNFNIGCKSFEKKCNKSCGCDKGFTCTSTDTNTCNLKGKCLPDIYFFKN